MELMSPVTIEVVPVENKKFVQPKKEKKRGGPYNKIIQQKRRLEVYKYYIEYNYPKTTIAEITGFNRHTIESDVDYIKSQLATEYDIYDLIDMFRKYKHRLELQNARLRK